jgi:hypothetical protein
LSTLPIESEKSAQLRFTLNGEETDVSFAPYKTLLEVLREDLGHTGTKHGCELGECGACAVLLDGKAVLSCLVLALECGGKQVLTVEGLGADGKLWRKILIPAAIRSAKRFLEISAVAPAICKSLKLLELPCSKSLNGTIPWSNLRRARTKVTA